MHVEVPVHKTPA